MAFEDLLNVLLVGVLVLVLFFQQIRKKAKQQEEEAYKRATQQRQAEQRPKQKEKIREHTREPHVHEALSERYQDDPSYQLDKEKKTSFGKRLLQDKSSIKKGIIISEIMKRPYDL